MYLLLFYKLGYQKWFSFLLLVSCSIRLEWNPQFFQECEAVFYTLQVQDLPFINADHFEFYYSIFS